MIEVVGCYPVDEASESCHVLELVVKDSPGFDVGGITQEDPTQPRENWQAAYDERLLTLAGDTDESGQHPSVIRCDPDWACRARRLR